MSLGNPVGYVEWRDALDQLLELHAANPRLACASHRLPSWGWRLETLAVSVQATLSANRRALGTGAPASEEDIVAHLVMPVIEHLGYSAATSRREYGIGRKRVDLALWPTADSTGPPSVIVEAKNRGADFDYSGAGLASTPMRQIEAYMVSAESRPDVLGALTDGDRWRLLRRTGSDTVETLGEWNVAEDRAAIGKLGQHIRRSALRSPVAPPAKVPKAVLDLLAEDAVAPQALFGALALQGDVRRDVDGGDAQARLAKAKGDWLEVAWTCGPKVEQDDLYSDASVVVGYAEVKSAHRDDVHVLLKALAARTQAGAAACLVAHRNGGGRTVRVAVHRGGRTGVGQPFDAEVPNDKAAETVNRLLAVTAQARIEEQRLEDVVSNHDVHKAFFDDIRVWVARQMRCKTRKERSAVLRHLLRCVFVWSIRERVGIPEKAFQRLWWRRTGQRRSYHKHFVRFLFHDRLNKRRKRREHPVAEVQDALRGVRYLNGSLFAEQSGDKELSLGDDDYFAHGERKGLWTIFAEHHWTTQEEDAEVREQSVDPKMLGGLFEHLMATVETGSPDNRLERMPGGTYYTPVDLVWEMARDALSERLLAAAPATWKRKDMVALFADGDLPKQGRKRVARELAGLTIFDPAVGSGEFLLGATKAIRHGLKRLGEPELASARRVVEEQIHGQDVNALAASVARLRLFIAIEDDEQDGEQPLPNLEAKIVCADSIGTEIRKGTTPLSANDPDVCAALRECQRIQDDFLLSHGSRKAKLREARRKAGAKLEAALRRTGDSHGSLDAFAAHDYLDHGNEVPVMTDPRWTFGSRATDGFDVVIGNPPYVGLRGMPASDREALAKNATRNGYGKFDDLFMPISEGALELAKSPHGTVCLVVPLSVSFASRKAPTRDAFAAACSRIMVRHQDNRPDTTFGHSPVEHEENRQRTTIVLAVRGGGKRKLTTGGLGRWPKAHRHRYLRSRPSVPWNERAVASKLPAECRGQWPRIATADAARVLREIVVRGSPMAWQGPRSIGLPKSAMYFVTAAPAGMLARGEETLVCDDVDPLLAVLNSGAAYLWWKAWGDGFHVKAATFAAMPDLRPLVPGALLAEHGAALRDALEQGERRVTRSGTGGGRLTENANLWETAGDVLDLVDEALLDGLGLRGGRYKDALAVERSPNIVGALLADA